MSGLTSDLYASVQSLQANSQAMDVTTSNIANLNTAGYARRRVVLQESTPTGADESTTGVEVQSIQSLRDNILEMRINQTTSDESASSTIASSLASTELMFTDSASGSIGSSIDSFFGALQSLSTTPSDTSLRSNVLTAASNVAASFQTTASVIANSRQQLDQSVVQVSTQVNSLLQQIASTNGAIATAQNLGEASNSEEDQRSALLTQLAGLIDFKTVNSSDGLTLTTSNGTPLVVGSKAYSLSTYVNASGYNDVYANGADITATITGGTLGGYLQSRDQILGNLSTQLDSFAYQFASAVNAVQTAGSDGNGNAGSALFNPPDTTSGVSTGAASSIKVALTSASQLATASNGGASGDNSNLANMIALKNQAVINGVTPTTAFANLSYNVGNAISQANSSNTATNSILTQLKNQQGSVSGVSTDEEAANLVQYQRSFQAAAKMISTIDTLLGVVLDMGATNPGY